MSATQYANPDAAVECQLGQANIIQSPEELRTNLITLRLELSDNFSDHIDGHVVPLVPRLCFH